MADANKTEQATPRRRQRAREQGQVARSRELPNVLAVAGAVGALMLLAPTTISHWTGFYRELLNVASSSPDLESNGPALFWSALEVLRWIVPVLAAALLCSLGAAVAQGGLTVAPAALSLRFERLNPATKLEQMVSPTSLVQLLKSLLPFTAIAWAGAATLRTHWLLIDHASSLSLRQFASLLGTMAYGFAWKAALILLAWSAVDYFATWRKMESDLRMSREELREEMKQSDGNPAIKRRIRGLRRKLRKKFSAKAAAQATVVVTNPTHYAVALRYEANMPAPVVVAKGMNLLAQQIKTIALENGIMTMENKPLAQALYKSVEVGDAIPATLYQAVADILAVVFRAQAEVRQQEARRRARNASGQPTAEAVRR